MKSIVFLTLIITIGCILATGCVGQIKKDNGSVSVSISPTNTFSPIVSITAVPTPVLPAKSGYNGTLIVSIGSWDELPLSIDNKSAGIATKDKKLMFTLDEGNHTVQVCSGVICVTEVVEIKFAKPRVVDFTEQLKRDLVSPIPTARILQYSRSGGGVLVIVEFINPSAKDLSMNAEVSVGYSFVDARTNQRVAETTRDIIYANVPAHQRISQNFGLTFADGYSYMYDAPILGQITAK